MHLVKFTFTCLVTLSVLLFSCQEEPFQQGKKLYEIHCENCHMNDGTGLRGSIPPLAQSDYLKNHQANLACIIKYGQTDTIIVNGKNYNMPMPGVSDLSEFQIANIINYINHSWGNDYGFSKVEDIRNTLTECE